MIDALVYAVVVVVRRGSSLVVKCPTCGSVGRLYYDRRIGWYVKHGSRVTHRVKAYEAIEVPLRSPRITMIQYMGGDAMILPYLAKMLAPHRTYVEVFGGAAPLLLNKPPSPVEVYNDIDGNLVNLFRVVRDKPDELLDELKLIPYSRRLYYEFLRDLRHERDPVRRAAMYYFIARASFSGKIGRGFATGVRTNRAMKYYRGLDMIPVLSERLRGVIIEELDFRECIKKYDTPQTLLYLDPPHLYIATEKGSGDYYQAGFTDRDYMDLLNLLEEVKGKWLLKQSWPTPMLLDWARSHGYSVRTIRTKILADRKVGEERRDQIIVFIANYRI